MHNILCFANTLYTIIFVCQLFCAFFLFFFKTIDFLHNLLYNMIIERC
nr:MAG TPA: hypothetical protein [Bacteriophage sp.]